MQVTQSPPKGLFMRRSLRNPRTSHAVPRFRRASILAALALSGILAAQTVALDPGATIQPGAQTPAEATAALKSSKTVVIAFIVPGAADDDEVAASIARLQKDSNASRNVKYLVYKVTTNKPKFGDLPQVLQILGTPTVAVITPDNRLQNMWTGLVDDVLIGQSIATARASGRGADSSPTPTAAKKKKVVAKKKLTAAMIARKKGLELVAKVNAAYANVPGIEVTGTGLAGTSTSMIALTAGSPSRIRKVTMAGTNKMELITTETASFSRLPGESCWRSSGNRRSSLPKWSIINVAGSTVSLAGKSGKLVRLLVQGKGVMVTEYLIDPATYELKVVTGISGSGKGAVSKYRTLKTAPKITAPSPLC